MHIISPTSDLLNLKFSEKGQRSGFWGAFQAILTHGQVWESLNWLFYEVPSSSNLCGSVNWNYAPRELNIFPISDTDINKYWFQQNIPLASITCYRETFCLHKVLHFTLTIISPVNLEPHNLSMSTHYRHRTTMEHVAAGPLASPGLNSWQLWQDHDCY